MAKVVSCSLIIRDDFNNILIIKKRVKRGQKEEWSILNQKIKGKENTEKCINRGVKDILKSIAFDLAEVKEYVVNEIEDESIIVFSGILKEKVTLDKNYKELKWINKNDSDSYEINDFDKKIIRDYFQEG